MSRPTARSSPSTPTAPQLRARHQRQPHHGRIQQQRRADEPDRLERLGDHDSIQRAGAHQPDHRPGRPVDHLHLRRQRPAPADVHRRVRHDDLHLRHRTDRGRCERPDFDHLRGRHGHRVHLRCPGPTGHPEPTRRCRDRDLCLSRAGRGYRHRRRWQYHGQFLRRLGQPGRDDRRSGQHHALHLRFR